MNQHSNKRLKEPISNVEPKDITIPIMIDDIKKGSGFDFTRCTYFSIQCNFPSPNWTLSIKNSHIPFTLTGLSGIIYEPDDDTNRFDHPQKINNLFDKIEADKRLYIDINDIWIPNTFFHSGKHARGSVYRILFDVFLAALSFRENTSSIEQFRKICSSYSKGAIYEDAETIAFTDWAKAQIGDAKINYQKNPKSQLRRIKPQP
jgi:hypothetical protein